MTCDLNVLIQHVDSILESVALDAFCVQWESRIVSFGTAFLKAYDLGPCMILITSLTRLRLPAHVMGYGRPAVEPPRCPRIWTSIAAYPRAAAVDLSSTLYPVGRIEAGIEIGGAGSLGFDGMGSGTSKIV